MTSLIFVLILACFGGSLGAWIPKHHTEKAGNGDNSWDYLLFVQEWPASECVDGHMGNVNSDACALPSALSPTDWTMHGIWPTKYNTEGPTDCDKTATFNLDLLDPIRDKLNMFWPSVETDKPYSAFWSHEWLKHGTCAQNLPALQGELNFFSVPLQLRKKLDIYDALKSQNIVPNPTTTYSHEQVAGALQTAFGMKIEVFCSYSKETKFHYVSEVRFCLTKDFTLMQCPAEVTETMHETASCPRTASLLYPPVLSSHGAAKPTPAIGLPQFQ